MLCKSHRWQYTRKRCGTLEEFLADPGIGPLGPYETCAVQSCSRPADRDLGYCDCHYRRWKQASAADPGLDTGAWRQAEPPAAVGGQVSLHGLPPLVAVQVLFGLQQRTRDGVTTADCNLRAACQALARQQVATIGGCDIGGVRGDNARRVLGALARYVQLAMTSPDSEQARDVWDLEVFGHRGRLVFTGITQPWLRESVKRWAAQDLPRHRGRGSCVVRNAVIAAARLSESLSVRPDHGGQPAALTRRDIENFLNRLGYLESAGTISRYQRNALCRGARTVLAGIRALGLARPGRPAAGLPGDIVIAASDIPPPGRTRRAGTRPASGDHAGAVRCPGQLGAGRVQDRGPDRDRYRAAPRGNRLPPAGLPDPQRRREGRAALRQPQGRPGPAAAAGQGRRLARRRLPEGVEGVAGLHGLIAASLPGEWAELDPAEAAARVKAGIETDRGPWVQALVAAGYEVFAINPVPVARYRERHSTSGAKSDLLTELQYVAAGQRVARCAASPLSRCTAT